MLVPRALRRARALKHLLYASLKIITEIATRASQRHESDLGPMEKPTEVASGPHLPFPGRGFHGASGGP